LALAVTLIRGLIGLIPEGILVGASIEVNGPALLFAAGVVTLSAFFFGLVPALHSTKTDVQSELKKEAGPPAQARRRAAGGGF
jgi:hypothetical protein